MEATLRSRRVHDVRSLHFHDDVLEAVQLRFGLILALTYAQHRLFRRNLHYTQVG